MVKSKAATAPSLVLAATVMLAVLVQAYAGAALRGLYADGAHFATQISAHRDLAGKFLPSRWMSAVIDQGPVLAAMHLGVQTPHGVALAFSIATNILPGIIILFCLLALPTSEKHFFIFPAFVYFSGTLSAQFVSFTGGLVATSYFWLLLFLITFGRLTIRRSAFILMLAAGSLCLHEQTLFLGPILIASCALRLLTHRQLLPRIVLSAAALCALASAVIGGYHVLHPIVLTERDSFITDFLAFRWIYSPEQGYNLPCVLGTLAASCIFAIALRPARGVTVVGVFAALSILLALAAFQFDGLTAPYTQWAARHNAALMSLPLGALVLVVRVHPLLSTIASGPAKGITALLGLSISLWHIAATEKWSTFLTHFTTVLQSESGVITWKTVAAPSGSRQAELARRMVWAWTNLDLSLVALQRTCVNSIIDNPPGVDRLPYDLWDIATMPTLPGVTYTYLLPPVSQQAACEAAHGGAP